MRRFFVFILAAALSSAAAASTVSVKRSSASWTLEVDGKPFFVKGVGCNTESGPNGEDYLGMIRDMGANAVRTWGITPRSYFDRAEKLGLKVNAGIWLNPVRSGSGESYLDAERRDRAKAEALAHVREMKNHPALLSWNIGNEVFAFTEDDEEKEAFGRFLDDLIRAVKREDPNHPVVYAAAGKQDLPYLQRLVPSLDIVGINTYAPLGYILRWMNDNRYDKPIVVTEFGPFGAWDRQKDANDLAYDPDDNSKAANYVERWRDIVAAPERALGGFAFVLGDSRNQDSHSWWNLNMGALRRAGYWKLYEAYTGKSAPQHSPRIRFFGVDRVTDVPGGGEIKIELRAGDPDGDPITTTYYFTDVASDPLIVQPARIYPAKAVVMRDGRAVLRVPNEPGTYRVYASVEDGKGNVAIANRSVTVIAR